ncbi:hypothetical protein QQF64_034546 [Cirrhinus molitorella]|uniref:Ig-like domain-containing protein n=1 Tax=Cirrhinus molitorella TaxID=172907 RepID=A0ABR3L152_9TELE
MSAEKEGEKNKGEAKRKAESMEQPKSKHRQQTYRTEWEKDSSFAGWLRPVSGNDSKAFCRCCNVHMVTEITVLKNHEKSKKHQDKKKNLAPAQRCEDLARDIYGYFKNSAKRVAQLREFQDFCHVEPHKLLKPCQTRWLSLSEVVKRVSAQWNALCLFFTDQWLEARLTTAENIFHSLNDESLRLYYYFLEWALPKFTDLNQYFQSEKVVITSLKNKVCETYKDLLLTFMDRDYVLHTPLNQIDINDGPKLRLNTLYLGVKVMQHVQQANITVAILTDFHVRCQNFLRVACGEIRKRFDFDDALLTQIACLPPATATDAKARTEFPSFLPLTQQVPRLIDKTDADCLQIIGDQWRRLPLVALSEDTKAMDVDEFWHHVSTLQDFEGATVFSELGNLSLPLDVEYQDKNTYSCVLNNTISNQTQHLNISGLCQTCAEHGLTILISAAAAGFLLIVAAVMIFCTCRKHKKGKHEDQTCIEDITYSETTFYKRKAQKSTKTEGEEVVYAGIARRC